MKTKEFPFEIKDNDGNEIYFEDSNGYWSKKEYDSDGNEIYYGNSTGFWIKTKYDSKGNEIYSKDSNGIIIDKRKPVELTLEDIAKKFGIDVNNLKIKK